MTKVLAVRYPSFNSDNVTVYNVDDPKDIKSTIDDVLFHPFERDRYDYCLVNYNNKLYVIEPIDMSKHTYNRKEITYHPKMGLIS